MKTALNKEFLIIRIFLGIFILGTLNSCTFTPEELTIDNYFKVKDKEFDLNYALIEDFGTNYDITSRYYTIGLQSENTQYPRDFIKFSILSTSTTRLNEGTYKFGYNSPGTFFDIEIGTELVYDYKFIAVSGERFYIDSDMKNGKIEISKKNDNYVFDFDFELLSSNSTYHITGYFTDVLHEDPIYY
jgi:hypothetical protein